MRFLTLVYVSLVTAIIVSGMEQEKEIRPIFVDSKPLQETRVEVLPKDRQTQAASRSKVRSAPKTPTSPSTGVKLASPEESKAYAMQTMQEKYNWGSDQYDCLVSLWNKESGWRVNADNPTSSAYGIPQALPGKKMGPGWQTDAHVQINWGLKYIENRYDTPCGAWSAFKKKGWY